MGDADRVHARLDAFMAIMTACQQAFEDKIMDKIGNLTSQIKVIRVAIRERELFCSQEVVSKEDFSQAADPAAATKGHLQPLKGTREQSAPTSATGKSSNSGSCPTLAHAPVSSSFSSLCKQLLIAKRLPQHDHSKKLSSGHVCLGLTSQILNNLFVLDFCSNYLDILDMVLDDKWFSILGPIIWDPGSTTACRDLNILPQIYFELEDKLNLKGGSDVMGRTWSTRKIVFEGKEVSFLLVN